MQKKLGSAAPRDTLYACGRKSMTWLGRGRGLGVGVGLGLGLELGLGLGF